ncbi:MAG: trypsin-like peptidase domain-containing protein [Ruminococcus sp.]|nr:trypsin-like peptidase domain-containing protein [Ruminococcus sp.]
MDNNENLYGGGSAEDPGENRQQVKYDAFMYEPIGFEEYARMTEAESLPKKKKHSGGNKGALAFFAVLAVFTMGLGVFGIVYDITTSRERLAGLTEDKTTVIFQAKKPDAANDIAGEIDEYGRYTTEGAAAAVRGSIVEIYTYSDPSHKTLVSTGSGVIITEDGYIVTNAHVLQADGYHDVRTADDKIYSAKIVGRDSKTDIAVIKVSADGLTPAVFGDSDQVTVGEQVIAIGNPAGLTGSVTDGIVSAVDRNVRSDYTGFEMKCIQTNAAISPGNSGGALVDMYGHVIGITSSKYVNDRYEGLGFAITINEVAPIIDELISNGFISGRFKIGITLLDMSAPENYLNICSKLGYDLPKDFKGIYIENIDETCDIAKTKLRTGDFITAIDGIPVSTYDELYSTITASYGAGDTVPADCAHVDEDGTVTEYSIRFKLMEDTSGDY